MGPPHLLAFEPGLAAGRRDRQERRPRRTRATDGAQRGANSRTAPTARAFRGRNRCEGRGVLHLPR